MKQQDLESIRLLVNNIPLDDFCGLTPNEVHSLLYDAFGGSSPLKIKGDISNQTLNSIPFFRLTEEFLKIIQRDRFIKLTPLGALPKKTLHELYNHRLIKEDVIEYGISKLTREIDSAALTSLHINTQLTGSIKKSNGKLALTKQGEKLLQPDKRHELFRLTLQTFTDKFNWSYNDGYSEHPIGQLGWGFSVYLLFQFGSQPQAAQFYADKYLKAFPMFLQYLPQDHISTPQRDFTSCYSIRTFDRFLEWFGFVDIEKQKSTLHSGKSIIKRTDALAQAFFIQ